MVLFLIYFHNITSSSGNISSSDQTVNAEQIGNYAKGIRRGLIWGNIMIYFGLTKWLAPRNTSVKMGGFRANIWTQDLPKKKYKC